jgi:multiple sugar transport system permease protein
MKQPVLFKNITTHFFLMLGASFMLLPFIWMISTSLKTGSATFTMPPEFIPSEPVLTNYINVFQTVPMFRFLLNSVFVSISNTFLVVLFSSMAGYAFARIEFRGRKWLFYLFLMTLMIPQQVTLTPLFILMTYMDWADTYQALILPSAFSAFGTFLMRQFFLGLPKDIEEAAFIDGVGHVRMFFSVAIHLAKPAMATLGIFAFMASWNNFLWPLIITSDSAKMTLPVGLSFLQGRWSTDWGVLMAGSVVAIGPILAVYVFAQRYIIQGLSHTGLK